MRRWSGVRYDRAGSLWLLPWVGPEDPIVALRIPLAGSAPDPDLVEVPELPAAFLPNGDRLIVVRASEPSWTPMLLRLAPADDRGATGH